MTIPSNNFKKISCLFYVTSVMLISTVSAYLNEVYNGYQFTLPDNTGREMRTQTDAQQWCKNNSNTLAEIYDDSFQDVVVKFVQSRQGHGLTGWITITNGKMFSDPSWNWVNGEPTRVSVDGPTNGFYSFGYLQHTNGGPRIVASVPYDRRGFICEGQSYCNGVVVARCFRNFTRSVTWFEARNYCLREGGDLASFDSVTSVQGLDALSGSWLSSPSTYWLGVRRQRWTWQESNTEIKYSQWSNDQPNSGDACLCLTPYDWKWSTCNCDTKYQFICVSAATTSATTMTSMKTAQTASRSATIRNATNIRILTIAEGTTNGQQDLTSPSNPSSPMAIAPSIKENHAVDATRLGVGLGVGLGGGILIIVVIIVVLLFVRRQRLQRSFKSQKPLQKPDIVLQSSDSPYALIPHQVSPGSGSDVTGVDKSDPSVVYADIQIIAGSLSSDESVSRSARLISQYPTPEEYCSHF